MTDALLAPPKQTFATILRPVPNDEKRMRVMLVHDEQDVLEHVQSMLKREDCGVYAFSSATDAIGELRRGLNPDIAFISARLQSADGGAALPWIRQVSPTVPAIALSCSHDPQFIVEAIRMGAADVLVHPFDRAELKLSLQRCFDLPMVRKLTQVREIPLGPNTSFVFCSESMRAIASQCELMASTDLPVLILGESGTGKEILAQYIHKMSACSNAPFLKVNCAAMPGDLLESELFGYEQGAFTGALKAKPGKFELCDRGTIFLDEIGEMPPALQAKLLQVLQDGTFSRLGGTTVIKVEVRVIAATNVDIKAAIADRRFREDLYYRINGFSFHLPPLRQRPEEIPVLIRYFMHRTAGKYARGPISMSTNLLTACLQHRWSGNLRELENFVKRFLVLGEEQVMMTDFPGIRVSPASEIDNSLHTSAGGLKKLLSTVKGEVEARVIKAFLQRNHWKRKKTAAELKISYKALLYKMRQHDIIAPPIEASC